MPRAKRLLTAAALAAFSGLAISATAGIGVPRAQPEPTARSNGVIGQLNGEGGDAAVGEGLYQKRCANCHDAPDGRAPPRAAIADNTQAFIADTMVEGVMTPMASGLTPQQAASIAAYLSTRKTGVAVQSFEGAPRCRGRAPPMSLAGPRWNGWGAGPDEARFQPDPGMRAADAPRLKLKWAFAYRGIRNGQATVAGGRVFLDSFSGAVYALDARTGCAYWRFDAPAGARSSIIVGRLPATPGAKPRYALYFTDFSRSAYALDAETGSLIWRTQVDDQSEVQMTGSPALHDGRLFVPISSAEEVIALGPTYECCKFRGAVAAVDAVTGRLLWKSYVTPEPKPFKKNSKGVQMYGPAGGAIWSAPTVDVRRGLIYVATGDSYTDAELPTADSVLALDERTGAIRWSQQLLKGDNFLSGNCGAPVHPANCPQPPGPDADFGASPILHTLPSGRQLILAGQKSAQIYALDPDARGKVVWTRRLSAGGPLGGVEFGMAADDGALYAPVSDIFTAAPKPQLTALAIDDGRVLWTAVPPVSTCDWKLKLFCAPGISQAVSAMPGLVFAGSLDGRFRAYDSATGKIVWETDTSKPVTTVSGAVAGGGVLDGAGPTIAGGVVYVNSGYQGRSGAPGNVLLAYSVDGK